MDYIFILAGLVFLFLGGDWLVKGAIALSQKMGLPAFLISLTVVGFGTSLPELLVSVRAALSGAPAIALGNVVGSNTANILLITGLAALIMPIAATRTANRRDLSVMVGASVVMVGLILLGRIGFLAGLFMVGALAGYLTLAYVQDRKTASDALDAEPALSKLKTSVFLIAGLGLLALGADLLVRGAVVVARDLGISNAAIGLTVVAVGTSLPEFATSVTAALKRQSDIVLGNVIGSNIFNALGILGVTALIAPIPVAARFAAIDGWVMLAASVLLALLVVLGKGFGRVTGGLCLLANIGYMVTMA